MKCLMVGKYCVLNIIRIKMLHIVVTSGYKKKQLIVYVSVHFLLTV